MRSDILNTLVCQQCFGQLRQDTANQYLICDGCGMAYPVSKGLVFMGYDESQAEDMEKIISTERDHQTDLASIEKRYEFAYPSFRIGFSSLNILRSDFEKENPVAVDIGSGGAPMSFILAENGFNTFRCELDPNSLYSGLIWKHPDLDEGKHIACDANLLPFASGSVDAVLCKEFVHHVVDFDSTFAEVSRILRVGGVFLLIEPTISRVLRNEPDDHFGHHYQTSFAYYESLKKHGFEIYRYQLYFYAQSGRFGAFNPLNKVKTCINAKTGSKGKISPSRARMKMYLQYLLGGTNVMYLRKVADTSECKERPRIQTVRSDYLVLDESYLNDTRLQKFDEILRQIRNCPAKGDSK